MVKQVHAVFFSPTGNTRKSVEAMAGALAENFEVHDVTLNAPAEEKIFGRDDVVIFGAPVYGGRIPAVARERLTKFRGEGTRCLTVVTFGNRDFDDALLELADLSKGQGFVVTAGLRLSDAILMVRFRLTARMLQIWQLTGILRLRLRLRRKLKRQFREIVPTSPAVWAESFVRRRRKIVLTAVCV